MNIYGGRSSRSKSRPRSPKVIENERPPNHRMASSFGSGRPTPAPTQFHPATMPRPPARRSVKSNTKQGWKYRRL